MGGLQTIYRIKSSLAEKGIDPLTANALDLGEALSYWRMQPPGTAEPGAGRG